MINKKEELKKFKNLIEGYESENLYSFEKDTDKYLTIDLLNYFKSEFEKLMENCELIEEEPNLKFIKHRYKEVNHFTDYGNHYITEKDVRDILTLLLTSINEKTGKYDFRIALLRGNLYKLINKLIPKELDCSKFPKIKSQHDRIVRYEMDNATRNKRNDRI